MEGMPWLVPMQQCAGEDLSATNSAIVAMEGSMPTVVVAYC
jgi:hypothetical protein